MSATLVQAPSPSATLDLSGIANNNIMIFSSATGGGHQSAARALEDSLMDWGRLLAHPLKVTTKRVLEESSQASRHLSDAYNYLLRHHQDWMKYFYWAVNHLKPNEWPLLIGPASRYGREVIEEFAPNLMVSVHPMLQHFCAYVLRRLGLSQRVPLVSVVTDPCYGFWRGWACDDVQHYFVATDGARQQLLDYGVDESRIRVEGMPVHPSFHPISEQHRIELRQAKGLDPSRMTVFINAGWVGGGNIASVIESFAHANLDDTQLVVLAGQNEALFDWAYQTLNHLSVPAKVLGTTQTMHEWMNVSDVMVSKLGGLTTFESLACGLPILADAITPPMPQEAHTGHYLETTGTGMLIYRPDSAVERVSQLRQHPEQLARLRQAAAASGHHGATERISRALLDITPDTAILSRSCSPSVVQLRRQLERLLRS
jgi:UDP-N-acetylglucosamine:LPS N-acetylglucosamine transferase